MATSPKRLTVDQAAELLGLSSHGVVELIASGELTWSMAAERKSVIVEVPSDPDELLRAFGCVRHIQQRRTPDTASHEATFAGQDAWSHQREAHNV